MCSPRPAVGLAGRAARNGRRAAVPGIIAAPLHRPLPPSVYQIRRAVAVAARAPPDRVPLAAAGAAPALLNGRLVRAAGVKSAPRKRLPGVAAGVTITAGVGLSTKAAVLPGPRPGRARLLAALEAPVAAEAPAEGGAVEATEAAAARGTAVADEVVGQEEGPQVVRTAAHAAVGPLGTGKAAPRASTPAPAVAAAIRTVSGERPPLVGPAAARAGPQMGAVHVREAGQPAGSGGPDGSVAVGPRQHARARPGGAPP